MDGYRHFYQKYLKLAPSESPFSFKKHSTIGTGGEAKIAFYPQTIDEMVALVEVLQKDGQPFVVLGGLSNVLPSDGLSDTIVICTRQMSGVHFNDDTFALAGTTTAAFLNACKKQGKSGGEFLYGIPCTIGGAAFMNAGAADNYIEDIIQSVLVYKDGALKEYPKNACEYAYKDSVFMRTGGIILGVHFSLSDAMSEEIEKKTAFFADKRKSLPKGRSMGCVFKNPEGDFAGRLIEEAGLKGRKIGGAYVSDIHANFILNEGESSQDIKELIGEIKDKVYRRFGIDLQEEIRYI